MASATGWGPSSWELLLALCGGLSVFAFYGLCDTFGAPSLRGGVRLSPSTLQLSSLAHPSPVGAILLHRRWLLAVGLDAWRFDSVGVWGGCGAALVAYVPSPVFIGSFFSAASSGAALLWGMCLCR